MKSWWKCVGACVFGLSMACQASAATETGRMSRSDATLLAEQLDFQVGTQALGPRDAAEQARARTALFALVKSGDGDDLDRAAVYAAARRFLETVDSGGHTQLWPRSYAQDWEQRTHGADAARADVTRILKVGDSDVLVVRPPQSTFMDVAAERDYALQLTARIEHELRAASPCALVVDLSDQPGGNAWPAVALFGALVTPDNRARYEDRTGQRTPFVSVANYGWIRNELAPLPANPLARLAGGAIGVVMTPMTASAGEMLAFMLSGEPTARTFGQPSYGATTGNVVVPLADGATALITTSRYAMADGAVVHGPLKPDAAAEAGESLAQSVQRAARWAADNSALCRASAGQSRRGR